MQCIPLQYKNALLDLNRSHTDIAHDADGFQRNNTCTLYMSIKLWNAKLFIPSQTLVMLIKKTIAISLIQTCRENHFLCVH